MNFAKLKNANQLDARCRKITFYTNLCYCCGGYKRYVEFGQICRRFCLYEQNLSGSRIEIETCKLKPDIPEIDTSIDIDEAYPQRPKKLNLTHLTCNCEEHGVDPKRCEVYKPVLQDEVTNWEEDIKIPTTSIPRTSVSGDDFLPRNNDQFETAENIPGAVSFPGAVVPRTDNQETFTTKFTPPLFPNEENIHSEITESTPKETCMVKEISSKEVKPCQFPFIYKNRTFHGCTTWRSNDRNSFLWCSTKTSPYTKQHIRGQKNYGACSNECLTHEKGLLLDHKKSQEKSGAKRTGVDLLIGNPAFQIRSQTNSIEEYEESLDEFSQRFLVSAWEDADNIVFSPFSLHSVVAMLISGATNNSKTQNELLGAFGKHRNIQNIEKTYESLIENYSKGDLDQILTFGNRLWTTKKHYLAIDQDYLLRIRNFYGADIRYFATTNPEKNVNDWVKETTKGKIKKIVDQISPTSVLLIGNALYFKDAWQLVFEDGECIEFTNDNGKKVSTRMMTRDSKKQIAAQFTSSIVGDSTKFLTVSIPYKFGKGRFEMIIIMPNHYRGLKFFYNVAQRLEKSSAEGNILNEALDALNRRENLSENHVINMPSFKVDSNIDVEKHLRKLGINAAFDDGGFKGIVKENDFKVSQVKHRAVVEVTKDGTEGAAASAIEIVPLAASISLPKTINIDKPFLFFIRDTVLKTLLFTGKYTNLEPTADQECSPRT